MYDWKKFFLHLSVSRLLNWPSLANQNPENGHTGFQNKVKISEGRELNSEQAAEVRVLCFEAQMRDAGFSDEPELG